MLLTQAGLELVERLERQKDIPSLLASFQGVVLAFGMGSFCIGDPRPKIVRKNWRWDGTWPVELYHHYAALNLFRIDPTVTRINADPSPFRWSENYERCTFEQKRAMDELAATGGKDGFAVPIHGQHGAVAGVSICTEKYEMSPQDEKALHMASLYLHACLSGLAAKPQPVRSLTPRERDCLNWVAAGKTDWEISQILGISEQTAHGYIQNALTKLNARTRAQAVALAMQTAQILP